MTSLSTSFSSSRILVIGGGRGIGAALAARLRAEGADVHVSTRDGRTGLRLDLGDEASIAAALDRVGELDHVVMTGSDPHDAPVTELDRDAVVRAFDAKVIGPMLVAKHAAPLLRPGGSLLLFSGVVGWRPAPSSVVKGTTNGAVAFAVTHLAAELAPVRVNAVSPGVVDSGAWDRLGAGKPEFLARAAERTLVRRHGDLDDVVDAAVWLLGARYVTGEVVHVEGGSRLLA
ncbi:NAD(P)-dependent dehydrogenase, short-chain alcohol dehydrogenase family [Nocardioides terrae]|uniref:NAD(P)-dependent dehydrogenase, short-chain alcohol dehydrogenase family n=1 Tax=Nocardioides terrae TaxID=574651 RepID=A0A1I1MDH5_9ACTN|nr:SDR family oxidoreductase [Nocardioides terrae]SFC83176.1 NAD(P)-dependent dehydrogenase, short-chain alcohol dehydrogenase family [Nocardioides terrae]